MGGGNLILLLTLVGNLAFSQSLDFECVTDENTDPDPIGVYSYATTSDSPSVIDYYNTPLVLNLYYWQVNNSNGEYNPNNNPNMVLNETRVLESVAYLNKKYNDFNIYFKYLGFEVIPETPSNLPNTVWELDPSDGSYGCVEYAGFDPDGYGIIDRCQHRGFFTWAKANYYNPNAINIYVPYGTRGYAGAADFIPGTQNIQAANRITDFVITHEVGHNLGIRHTRSTTEHVTRDFQDPDFNATTRGDNVVDTNANRFFRKSVALFGTPYPYVNLQTCQYEPNGVFGNLPPELDNVDKPYVPQHYDITNAMSDCGPCMDENSELTMGQGIRARETIINRSDPGQTFGGAITTLASLYEPYKGEYYVSGPLPSPPNPPLFQPGFNYNFKDCSGNYPEPSAYEDTSFTIGLGNYFVPADIDSQYFNTLTHPNHKAIDILFNNPLPNDLAPSIRKCYDNYNRAPVGGSVTKFNDNVFNTNVTITPQDSNSINDPNLINQLDAGLYKVEKQYDDGTVEQTVIVKDNQ